MTDQHKLFKSKHMARAVDLARRFHPSPNPRVGAVIVKHDTILGEGAHEKPGAPHAEIVALEAAGENAGGADLYVTLEPCVHVGRTGPCVKAIENAGIRRVFVGMGDPDGRVNGQGIQYLRDAGIEVRTGVDEGPCRKLLESYITHRTLGRPHITLKAAITLDGYIASTTFDSKWISSERSRKVAHAMRAESDAILVGLNTVKHDDPLLTVRAVDGPSPTRVILDTNLQTRPDAAVIKTASDVPVYLVHGRVDSDKRARYENFDGVTLIDAASDTPDRVDLERLVHVLGNNGILSLLVEGGATVLSAFLASRLADHLVLFIAPRILGRGISFSSFPGATSINEGLKLSVEEVSKIDCDVFYRAKITNRY